MADGSKDVPSLYWGENIAEVVAKADALVERYQARIDQQAKIIDQQKTQILMLNEKVRRLGGGPGGRGQGS